MDDTSKKLENQIPTCVGFIMDGNRRWAQERNEPTVLGHQAGKEVFDNSVTWIQDLGIPHAVYYAFSTENWQRTEEEVTYLMNLFTTFITALLSDVLDRQVRVRFIGERSHFSRQLQTLMAELEENSAHFTATTIWVALSYGGRAEIVSACNQAIAAGVPVDEAGLAHYLQTNGMPDPDLIIRTSGEKRLSNFLPWQSVYSELFFTDTYWPAFTKEEFTRIVGQYGDRQRRRGK
jgi:undecaprenyl diphosphate synthase